MKKKILIIEDDKTLLSNISLLLTEEGYLVIEAKNGEAGVNAAIEEQPSLIICDIMMPKKNGYKVIEELSENNKTKLIPFLFLTAKVNISDMRKGMGLGADDYLFKPFKSGELLKAIEVRLNKYSVLESELNSQNEQIQKEDDKTYSLDETLVFNDSGKPKFFKIQSILFITAENQYTNVHMENKTSCLFKKSLTYWERTLPKNHFIRIHRSTIININHLAEVKKKSKDSLSIILKNNEEPFSVSKSYTSQILSKIRK